jgi:hypothetical protein
MKSVDIKPEADIQNNEQKIEFKISVGDFDINNSQIASEEDIDVKMIGYIEKQVRNSYEYRAFVKYMKEELDLTKCAMLPNIDIKDVEIPLEFHHHPFTLYDITEAVSKSMFKDLKGNDTLSAFDVAEKVLHEHYENKVGLVPLTETLHEMAHNNAIIVPMDKVNGNYKEFIREYGNFLDKDKLEKIDALEKYSVSDEAKEINKNKLQKRIVNYDINYIKSEGENNEEI